MKYLRGTVPILNIWNKPDPALNSVIFASDLRFRRFDAPSVSLLLRASRTPISLAADLPAVRSRAGKEAPCKTCKSAPPSPVFWPPADYHHSGRNTARKKEAT